MAHSQARLSGAMIRTARFFTWPDRALYLGMGVDAEVHCHHAVQVCISLEAPILVRTPADDAWKAFRAVMIKSDAPHQFQGRGQALAMLYIDPHARDTLAIREYAAWENGLAEVSISRFAADVQTFRSCLGESYARGALYAACNHIIQALGDNRLALPKEDRRILNILHMLNTQEVQGVSLRHIAALHGMSFWRLAHLFKDQVGLPMRRYLLWRKIILAVQTLEKAATFTEAAHHAGFSDAAHMNRTLKRMCGIKPSFFHSRSKFVQVISCSGQ